MSDSSPDRRRISRRSLLIGGSGLLAAYAVGCGGDDEEPSAPTETSAATATGAPATAIATPEPTQGALHWRRIEAPGGLPQPRTDHSLVTGGGVLVLYGGRTNGTPLGDLWTYDLAAGTWLQITSDVDPPGRFGHNAIYDNTGERMIVFGGQAGATFFDDLWALENNTDWRQLDVAGPPERYGAASALATDGRLLVSHGFTNQGRFDDTWSLDASPAWADVSASGTRPVKRCLIRGVWDTKRDRFLIFGGQTDGQPFLGDLWAFDGRGWTELTAEPRPLPRNFYAMVETDPGRIVLFGGNTADGPVDDILLFDSQTDAWTGTRFEGDWPSARYGHDAVWVPEGRKLIVFGGHDASGDLNDLWELTIPA